MDDRRIEANVLPAGPRRRVDALIVFCDGLRRLSEVRFQRVTRICYGALIAVSALIVLCIFLADPGIEHYQPSSFGNMVDGQAARPFVYRALVPTTVRVVSSVFPASAHAALTTIAQHGPFRRLFAAWDHLPADYALEVAIALPILYGSLIGFVLTLRRLATTLFELPRSFARKIPLIALVMLPPMFRYTSFIYDFPALFLFTLGLLLMLRQRWRAYFVLLACAALNKETAILLPFVFGLYFWRHQELLAGKATGKFWPLVIAQLAVCLIIKLGLQVAYSDNPGGAVEHHFHRNLDLLRTYSIGTAVGALVLATLIGVRWSEAPRFLRTALWCLPVLVGLTLFLGYLDELRDYYEALPVIVLLVAHGIARLIGVDIKVVPESRHRFQLAVQ